MPNHEKCMNHKGFGAFWRRKSGMDPSKHKEFKGFPSIPARKKAVAFLAFARQGLSNTSLFHVICGGRPPRPSPAAPPGRHDGCPDPPPSSLMCDLTEIYGNIFKYIAIYVNALKYMQLYAEYIYIYIYMEI